MGDRDLRRGTILDVIQEKGQYGSERALKFMEWWSFDGVVCGAHAMERSNNEHGLNIVY